MDASFLLLVIFLLTMYLQTVLSSKRDDTYMDFLAERLTSNQGNDRLHVWHSDCFSRCGHQFERTIELACSFDPYRRESRGKRSIDTSQTKRDTDENSFIFSAISTKRSQEKDSSVFFTKRLASSFLHHGSSKKAVLKRKKRGITEECCYNVCAWEEYGEYCHGHLRTRNRRPSICL